MGMQGGSIGAIALGVVIAIVGVATGNYELLVPAILLIAGGATGLAFPPKAASRSGAKSQNLDIATASEGFPIPVIVGEQKVTGNYMQWSKEFFRHKKIYGQPVAGGGKGGGSDQPKGVIGFDYYLAYEYALCMGPIDSCMQVWSSPGEVPMRDQSPVVEIAYATGQDYIEVSLANHNEGGIARLYRGSPLQTRTNPGGSDPYVQDNLAPPNVTAVAIVSGGTGYAAGTKAAVTGDGTGAEVAITVTGGVIVNVRVTKRGYGYTAANIVLSNIGSGSGASFIVTIPGATMNYRNICFALMGPGAFTSNSGGFKIGRFPQPKSYQFILRRLPGSFAADMTGVKAMRRDDYSVIAGFQIRGSGDATKPSYVQGNPAAFAYEVMTNKIWGRGLSSSLIDETSFVAASQYFYARNLGISYTIDAAAKITDFLDILRTHFKTILVWDGETLKMRVLMNPAETSANIQTLNESQVVNLRVTRPDWFQTYNEIRAEFNNVARNYRPDVIHVIDGANVALVGGRINPLRIQLPALADFNTAWKMTQRILREYAYPLATATFEMNMFKSGIEVGDTFRLIWSEYGTGKQTMYFTCLKKVEASSSTELVKITAVEDINLSGVDAEETEITVPDKQPWELLPDLNANTVGLFIVPGTVNDDISPIAVIELSPLITVGNRELIFLGQRRNRGVTGFAINFKQDKPDFTFLDNYDSFAITGALLTAVDDVNAFDRTPEGAFDFSLISPEDDEGPLLAACSRVILSTDDLETLADSGGGQFWIGEECILVGYVQRIDVNQYRAFNVIRGAFGTDAAVHAALVPFYFVDALPLRIPLPKSIGLHSQGEGSEDATKTTQFIVNPIGTIGVTETGDPFYPFHEDPDQNQKIIGVGNRPLSPIPLSKSNNGDGTYNFVVRPRNFHKGADTKPFFQAILEANDELDNLEFLIQQIDINGDPVTDTVLQTYYVPRPVQHSGKQGGSLALANRTPSDMIDPAKGIVTIVNINREADTVEVRIFARLAGFRSINPARFYF
jgi:hypothetical protein